MAAGRKGRKLAGLRRTAGGHRAGGPRPARALSTFRGYGDRSSLHSFPNNSGDPDGQREFIAKGLLGTESLAEVHHVPWYNIIVLLLMVLGVLPTWPHSASWGYLPSGGLGVLLVVIVVLAVVGRI